MFNRLKQDALENYAISLVKCRSHDSTARREFSRKQGTTTNQLTIIGRDCGFVFKLFRKAALDAGLQMPDRLPHMRIPVAFGEDSPPLPPPHPDDSAKRNAPPPPPPGLAGQAGSSGGGLPATEQGSADSSGGGGLPPTGEDEDDFIPDWSQDRPSNSAGGSNAHQCL